MGLACCSRFQSACEKLSEKLLNCNSTAALIASKPVVLTDGVPGEGGTRIEDFSQVQRGRGRTVGEPLGQVPRQERGGQRRPEAVAAVGFAMRC